MNRPKGFTLVELMVVIAVVSILMAVGIPMGLAWKRNYQFSAVTNNFINAAQLTRVRAIGGPITMNIYTNQPGDSNHGLTGSSKTITVTIAVSTVASSAFTFLTLYPLSSPSTADIPLKVNDYVTLVGINEPDFLSGNIFRVKTISASTPVYDSAMPKYTYKVAGLSFTCESCSESNPSVCIEWPAGVGAQDPATGKVQIAPCLKFTTLTDKRAELGQSARPYQPFSVEKYGNSMECIYDPGKFSLGLWVLKTGKAIDTWNAGNWVQLSGNEGTGVTAANSRPIVFDTSGTTRNHDTYMVRIARQTGGNDETPAAFIVWPTGRITLETQRY
jgi:prepilin-type N-terminal cleavage/methylation domain-containing protein